VYSITTPTPTTRTLTWRVETSCRGTRWGLFILFNVPSVSFSQVQACHFHRMTIKSRQPGLTAWKLPKLIIVVRSFVFPFSISNFPICICSCTRGAWDTVSEYTHSCGRSHEIQNDSRRRQGESGTLPTEMVLHTRHSLLLRVRGTESMERR
jgi:hypothetical protein